MQRIYVACSEMSSPNQIEKSRLTNSDMTLEVDFKFPLEKRKKIAAIRTLFKKPLYNNALNFHGSFFCKDDQRDIIEKSHDEADKKLKEVDKSLKAKVYFIEITSDAQKGEEYRSIIDAINFQIISDILRKMEIITKTEEGKLPERSQKALLKLLDRLRSINILDDENIAKKLERIKEKILNSDVAVIKEEFVKEIASLKGRGAFLEFKDR